MLRHRLSYLLIMVMYLAYLDGSGNDGPFVSRNQTKYFTRPVYGLAGFAMPADPEVIRAQDRDPVRTAVPFSSRIRTCINKCGLPQGPPAINKPSRSFCICEDSVAGSSAHLSWKESAPSADMRFIKMTVPYNLPWHDNVFILRGTFPITVGPVASRHFLAFNEHAEVVSIKNTIIACSCPCM